MFSKITFMALAAVLAATISSSEAKNVQTFSSLKARDTGYSCPANIPTSCSNTTAVDTCCFEYPGGVLLQTQFWDYKPATGPSDAFTIHGLWPDNCDGTYQQFCDTSLEVSDVTTLLQNFGEDDLLSYMQTYWKDYQGNDESLWEHEYNKHGTCLSTLSPNCYSSSSYQTNQNAVDFYKTAVSLYKGLPTYQWLSDAGITPSSSKTYSASDISNALAEKYGAVPYLGCKSGALTEVWYFHHLKGSVTDGSYIPIDSITSSTCSGKIYFHPKSSS